MTAWQYYNKPSGARCCAYIPDSRFELRRILTLSGLTVRWVWALYFKGQRIYEVHAMSRIKFVQSDAWDYIKEEKECLYEGPCSVPIIETTHPRTEITPCVPSYTPLPLCYSF